MKRFIALGAALLVGAAAVLAQDWALVGISVAPMREEPSHAAEQSSQALMGTPVKILNRGKEWSKVETPDGYHGYIINHSLSYRTDEEMAAWRRAPRVAVITPFEIHAMAPDGTPATDLVNGCILEARPDGSLLTPLGIELRRMGTDTVMRLRAWAADRPLDTERLLRFAKQFYGVPYLWGGLSSKGTDCSGLVRMAYLDQGKILKRDAREQILTGRKVPQDSIRRGDLIYFGNPSTGRVTHVAIYDGPNGEYVHSNRSRVRRDSFDPASPIFYDIHILGIRRIPGQPLSLHPWYF